MTKRLELEPQLRRTYDVTHTGWEKRRGRQAIAAAIVALMEAAPIAEIIARSDALLVAVGYDAKNARIPEEAAEASRLANISEHAFHAAQVNGEVPTLVPPEATGTTVTA